MLRTMLLAALLIGQFETAKALAWKFKKAVNPPDGICSLGSTPGFCNNCGIDQADEAALSRIGRGFREHLTDQQS